MSPFVSYERLDRSDAARLIIDMFDETPEQLKMKASTSSLRAYPPPITDAQVSKVQLKQIRADVIDIAEEFHFPHDNLTSSLDLSLFDRKIGNYMLKELRMSPVEAAREEVWNFLTLVVLPDVAAWRYKNPSRNPEFPRWIGVARNVFRKAWWRAYSFGPEANMQLGEDEGVNIMERPTFGLNPVLARHIAETHLSLYDPALPLGKSALLRLVMVRLGMLVEIVDLDTVPEEISHSYICNTYNEVINLVKKQT